jgi:aminopeptidase N
MEDEATVVESNLRIEPNDLKTPQLKLDGIGLKLLSIKINGVDLAEDDYQLTDEQLIINNPPQQAFQLTTQVEIKPKTNKLLSGLYLSSGKFCTQCEAEGFRRITYYLDRPDNLSIFTVKIIADKAQFPFLLSNGNLQQQGELENGQHFALWHDPFPKPSYLFALVAGDFDLLEDHFTTMSKQPVLLQIYVDKGQLDKCQYAMESLIKSMQWDERVFGREYDLERYMIVAVSDFNMGAMENKGLNVFNTKYVLASKSTATDDDFIGVEAVIGHEYFHNWTGNRITCRDWFQLSLKEGLTVFRDQEFTSDLHSRAVKRIQDVQIIRSAQFAEDAGPMAHPIRPDSYIEMNNFYTVTVYNKGAEVIRMQHTLLGADGFKKGMDYYFDKFDGQAVTCEDFIQSMETPNQKDLSQLRLWYSQAGTPVVEVLKEQWNEAEQSFTLVLKQHCDDTPGQTDKKPFLIPFKMALVSDDGNQLKVTLNGETATEFVLEFNQNQTEFVFTEVNQSVVASLLRDFSAPIKLIREVSNQQLLSLYVNDSNSFSQWDAGQVLVSRIIWDYYDAINNDGIYQLPENFVAGVKSILSIDKDPDFIALLLQFPGVSVLQADRDEIDIVALYRARKAVLTALCKKLTDELTSLWKQLRDKIQNSDETLQSGYRSLANQCLSMIHYGNDEILAELASRQFKFATNMTDELAAYKELVSLEDNKLSKDAIEQFYKRWNDQDLVMDKWLMVQACCSQTGALNRVQELWSHPVVVHTNPNKVRSLIAGFTMNIEAFHNKDGSGYEWFSDRIIELDSINPQISARLVSALNNWKKYDSNRQQLIKSSLHKILEKPTLSKDVYEIVSKALA